MTYCRKCIAPKRLAPNVADRVPIAVLDSMGAKVNFVCIGRDTIVEEQK